MKKRFSEEKIIQFQDKIRDGKNNKKISRQKGVTIQTIYSWKKKFDDMSSEDAQKLRSLKSENARLKRIVADLSLDIQILKDVN